MTRIIGGEARGRLLKVPKTGTRPTSDRVRESLFNILDHRLGSWSGLRVLDLYAGSGAFALEALSRGASAAVCVEISRPAADVIRANAKQLGYSVDVRQADAAQFSRQPQAEPFDLVFIDPPYELETSVLNQLLVDLNTSGAVTAGSWAVVERSGRSEPISPPGDGVAVEPRKYGETSLYLIGW